MNGLTSDDVTKWDLEMLFFTIELGFSIQRGRAISLYSDPAPTQVAFDLQQSWENYDSEWQRKHNEKERRPRDPKDADPNPWRNTGLRGNVMA